MEDIPNENQKSTITRHSSMSVFVIILGIFLLVLLGLFGWYVLKTPATDFERINKVIRADTFKDLPKGIFSYTIPGVPYFGVHNRVGERSYIKGDPSGAVVSILEYWNPGEYTFREINEGVKQSIAGGSSTNDHIQGYILSLGDYVVKEERLTLYEIKEYINSEVKTPLFLFLALSVNQPIEPPYYYPATVLIGIDEPEEKLIFSSYWMGNNYEVSFEEFQILQNIKLPDDRNVYFIIQPKNLNTALTKMKNLEDMTYSPRGILMRESEEMFKNYTVGVGAVFSRAYKLQEQYFELVAHDPKFSQFMPPYFKVFTLYSLAEAKLILGKNSEAKKYALMAVEFNHDFDKPFEDFPGFEIRNNTPDTTIDRLSDPYRVLGDVHMKLNEFEMAREAYKDALAINSKNAQASRGLQFTEILLNPETDLNIDTEAFINILIQKSPWSASWKRSDDLMGTYDVLKGTYKISFIAPVSGETELSGKLFDSSLGAQSDALKNIVIKDNCVSFNFSSSEVQSVYDQCLTKNGLLEGVLSNMEGSFWVKTISTPSQ